MPEQYAIYLLALGLLLIVAGWIWLVIAAFRERVLWGLVVLLLPLVGALAFLIGHTRKSIRPLVLFLAGGLVMGGTYAVNYYQAHYVDLGPREKVVDGEVHITLTGWDGNDYSILKTRPEIVVLQMANEDVTDQTLEHLRGMSKLREVDVNYSQVTDEGLQLLNQLPQLQILRLRKTKVTDQGFQQHLGDKESLLELDLRETQVSSKTLREWKAKRKDERKYLR